MHPGYSWEVFLTFLARPGPASLMRSQPRAWACLPTYPTEETQSLPAAHPCARGFLSPPADQAARRPSPSLPSDDAPAPGPSCPCKAHMLTVCSTCSPCGPRTLGCVALTPTGGEFQTEQIREPCAQPVLTPIPPEGKGQRGCCSPRPTPSPLPSPANISPPGGTGTGELQPLEASQQNALNYAAALLRQSRFSSTTRPWTRA